ncbi:hypothetical protein DWZ10_14365 [Segatella copri]|uniref:Major fimbrial subunit protein N-terminal domain-containing protein n=1 Tax=Segatella copri TaxID=165179 RepID=A0AA92VZK1_9BACT|nr:hypothetical protein DXB80_13965 [Segatella copri]RGQ03472.1 hypothetical protein DWZ10_14365 [Segatella copri]
MHVLVPTVLSSRGTNPDDASGLPTYNATVNECQINDLTLYAFPVENEGKLLVETLPAPLATMMVEQHVANYQLNIEPGTYHIYVVANMNKVLSGKPIKTEDELKNIVLNYVAGTEPGMPVSTNIPMIYEPKDVNGTIIDTKIEKGGKKYTEVAANLKFTCVKVKLNLIFDPTAEGSAFNGNSYIIKDILAQKLSPSTTLSWDGAFSKPASSVSQDYANGFESEVYATSSEASNKGSYYKAEDWTEDATNANVNNKDIITLVQGATPTPALQNTAAKWLFQGTYYLPERYIAEASQQSTLKVNGSVNGNIENYYKIKLGHRQDESPTPTFPRGTYYEIIGKIKSLGNMTLNCNVSVKDWKPVTIDADFSHTTLWVNKTSAQITSIEEDSISYKSNWVNVEFGCDAIVDGKPLVVVDKRDEVNHIITFRINPEIPMSAYGEGKFPPKGTTKIWLKANNLKKYLDVDYNVEPLFEVDPLEVIIYYEASAKTNTKVFTWVTNLGGIVLPDELTSTIGSSKIKISKPSDENAPKGTFQVEATTDPGTTTVHTFRVHSKDLYNSNNKYRDIKVTVRPPVDNYRIYFRAINDRSSNNGKYNTNQFQGILDEYYGTGDNNKNWNDSWSWDNKSQTSKHNVYIYSQKGETTGTAIPKENVWYFTNRYNNPSEMKGDTNNPGWYYKDMDFNAKGYRWDKGDGQETTTIKPGETLMIFYSFNNDGADLHRCPQHMAPGIPLFNYEDREGWILYDPTTDPYYRIFDEKPIVKDINYVVYTKNKVLGWAFKFGVATDSPTSSGDNNQYMHWDNTWDGHSAKSFKSEQVGDWWKTTIRLKAVDGYHEKGIVLQFEKDAYEEKYTLFGGRSYEKYNDTGYYDNGSWHPGKPSDV